MIRSPGAWIGAAVLAVAALSAACGRGGFRVEGASSDGLVFVRLEDGVKDLARARLADGVVEALRPTPEREEDWPYWSDAAGLLLVQARPRGGSGPYDLVVIDPGTGRERPLAADPARDEQWPMWSPDGASVVFAFLGREPPSGIGLVRVASGEARVLAPSGPKSWFFRPHFAPDGRRIVAQKRWGDTPGSSLWLVGVEGNARPLLDDRATFYQKPWFTRDGRRIVYSARPAAGGTRDVYVVDAEGATPPRAVVEDADADDHSAYPSPTRDEVVFVSSFEGRVDVWLQDLAGGPARNLTRSEAHDEYAPQFSPDGERIVLTAGPARRLPPGSGDEVPLDGAYVVVIDREGRRLFETPGFMADWMPPF